MIMQITRDLIEDLIPIYLSGDASEGSKKVIDQFMKENPNLNYLLDVDDIVLPEIHPIKPENEMQTLKKIKALSLVKSLFIGLGLFFSLSIFVFTFSSEDGIKWLMLGDNEITMVYASFALICWLVVYFVSWTRTKISS